MFDVLARGLDLRSPDARLTFRNRVAKMLKSETADALRAKASEISGQPPSSFNRVAAIKVIAEEHMRIIRQQKAA